MPVRVRVFDSRIYAMNAPGGEVHRWMTGIKHDAQSFAVARCPKRTGQMAESIETTIGYNQYGVFVNLYAHVGYAKFVVKGTTGPITPKRAPYMRWWGWGPWTGLWRRKVVRGQRANDFLERAAHDALAAHGVG